MKTDYDVLVVGGGPAGVAAAVAAARMKQRVALLERHEVLGGMGTVALVNNFCPAHLDGKRIIIGGLFGEMRRKLIELGAIYASPDDAKHMMEPYDPVVFADVLSKACREAGVEIFTKSGMATPKIQDDKRVHQIIAGDRTFTANTIVDASGDASVAAAAGARFNRGRVKDGRVMPLTFCYKIGPVDIAKLKSAWPHFVQVDPRTRQEWISVGPGEPDAFVAQARERGELTIQRDHISGIASVPGQPKNATVNFGRVWCTDPTDPKLLEIAELEGRKQIDEGVAFFRKYLPGFGGVKLIEVARQIGVRESRQIIGEFVLNEEDCLSCRQFDDVITQCCYMIDIHSPDSDGTVLKSFATGTHYDIPLRCLIPVSGAENMIVAGRSISATHEAMSSFRVSPSVMAIGEAAGVTAALAAIRACAINRVDAKSVQQRLLETGSILT